MTFTASWFELYNWWVASLISGQISNVTHAKDFCEENALKSPDLKEMNSAIAILRQQVPAGPPKYGGIRNYSCFPLWPVAKFG
jgi:hypothetical protein